MGSGIDGISYLGLISYGNTAKLKKAIIAIINESGS